MKLRHLPLLLLPWSASAAESALPDGATESPTASSPDAWERFNDWSIGDVLFPNLHLHGVGGFSSGEPGELASGGHDPQREAFSAQAIEPGLSLRTQYLEGFANYLFFQDGNGDWDGELEEAFGKIVNVPGGFEIKAGQYFSRFGALNDKHLHAWDFVDSETVLNRFLGDDGLLLKGAELSWTLPLGRDPSFISIASLGFGNARSHNHGHGHGGHGGHDDDHDDHGDDHDDHHDDDHDDHGGGEIPHEGEEGALADDVWTARWMGRYRSSDFHTITAGLSMAGGTNGFGRNTRVLGLDAEYLWRERGLEAGGRAFRWRSEVLWRDVQAFSEHDEGGVIETFRGTYDEWGFYTHAIYTWNTRLDTGLRVGWVEGVDDFGQDERLRISPTIAWWFDDARRIGLRAQYNYDSIASRDDEHSLWLQLNIALGSTRGGPLKTRPRALRPVAETTMQRAFRDARTHRRPEESHAVRSPSRESACQAGFEAIPTRPHRKNLRKPIPVL